jgi:hypothetical protein
MTDKLQTPSRPSEGWTGLVGFGGIMFVVLGATNAMMGFVAAFDRGFYEVPAADLALPMDYTIWGWIHLAFGIGAVATGLGLLTGRRWASPVGIGIAVCNAITNLLFSAAYPWWAATVIAFDVLLVFAITKHRQDDLRRPE